MAIKTSAKRNFEIILDAYGDIQWMVCKLFLTCSPDVQMFYYIHFCVETEPMKQTALANTRVYLYIYIYVYICIYIQL